MVQVDVDGLHVYLDGHIIARQRCGEKWTVHGRPWQKEGKK